MTEARNERVTGLAAGGRYLPPAVGEGALEDRERVGVIGDGADPVSSSALFRPHKRAG